MKTYKISLYSITPLIIHTGEFYNINEILPTKDERSVLLIDMDKAFSAMNQKEREQFFNLMDSLTANNEKDKDKLLKARSMFQSIALQNPEIIIQRVHANPAFIKDVNNNPYANIYKIFKDEISNKPYIPGSTLKGALRTAILESIRKKNKNKEPNYKLTKNDRPKRFETKDFEMQIMKDDKDAIFDIKSDPFKYIKVSDVIFNTQTVLFDTVRVIGKDAKQKGIPIYTEMTSSYYTDKSECIAEGEITVDDKGLQSFYTTNKFGSFIGDIEFVKQSIQDFSNYILSNKKHPVNKEVKDTIENLCKSKGLIPLRLGRFTQIESKTFKIIRKDARPQDINIAGGVSRSLVHGEIPAGWCGLKIEKL